MFLPILLRSRFFLCVCVSCSELRKRKRVLTEEEQLLGETEDGIAEEEKSNAKTAAADEAGMCA